MSPRVEHIGENVTLYLGDCREILPTLGKVDAALVTDGPYGYGYQHGQVKSGKWQSRHHNESIEGDDGPFDPRPFLKIGSQHLFFGANNFAHLLPPGLWAVWDKRSGVEQVKISMSPFELAWMTGEPGAIRAFRNLWFGLARGSEVGEHHHPTQKPVELMCWCIEQIGDAETILDPFMGSGTTGVAAVKLGRKFIGIEIEPKYFDIACRRIANEASQSRMVFEEEKPKPIEQARLEL
jgi:DNA methylase